MKLQLKATTLAALTLMTGLCAGAHAAEVRKPYIVQLKGEPTTTYAGTVAGYAATQASKGQRYQPASAAVQAYAGYLTQQQTQVLSSIPAALIHHRYATVLNGFSASLTDAEALVLATHPQVAQITPDMPRKLATVSTPRFLGLSGDSGVWSQLGADGLPLKGEGLVIGVIDSGIWPENAALFDQVDAQGRPVKSGGTLAYGPRPASFTGSCVDAPGFVAARDCNNKLIGAKAYSSSILTPGRYIYWADFEGSPRDALTNGGGGHGDHTASTAAGNANNLATVGGLEFGMASGMAPRARVAAYKACWSYYTTDPETPSAGCATGDSVAAIDQAVKDGVNAINFSISGSQTNVADPVEQAFFRAAQAGVFVAAAAANSGPANNANHPSPWLTTVAATSHDRILQGTVTLRGGGSYTGRSMNGTPLGNTALIRAEDAGLGGGPADLCVSTQADATANGQVMLDPAKVAGKIVICTRGIIPRVNKSQAVLDAGGVGMVLVDNGTGLVSELHSVPTVMVSAADGAAIKAYATGNASPQAALSHMFIGSGTAPVVASFSSRGPNLADANILKPDIAAPGVDVIAQVAQTFTQEERDALIAGTLAAGSSWASYSGTSMATPHVSGVSLLVKQAHPGWSPAAIKSALMTTAMGTLDDGLTGAQAGRLPWGQGAGMINVAKALDPGLVYDAGKADYTAYLCLVKPTVVDAADCASYGTLDNSRNLNLPSITISDLGVTPATVRRSVTNVGTTAATYTASLDLPGFTASVSPATLELQPGQTKSYTLTVANNGGEQRVWRFGSLRWSDGTHNVVSPVQIRYADPIVAPHDITATSLSGMRLMNVRTEYAGTLGLSKAGMVDVTMGSTRSLTPRAVGAATLAAECRAAGADTASMAVYAFNAPSGTLAARFALRQEDVGGAEDDHDLVVIAPDGQTLSSLHEGSNEAVQLSPAVAGRYKVCVAAVSGSGASLSHRLSSWIVAPDSATAGKLSVFGPAKVYLGRSGTVSLNWSGLQPGHRYLGAAGFSASSSNFLTTTVLRVETNGGLPVPEVAEIAAPKRALND